MNLKTNSKVAIIESNRKSIINTIGVLIDEYNVGKRVSIEEFREMLSNEFCNFSLFHRTEQNYTLFMKEEILTTPQITKLLEIYNEFSDGCIFIINNIIIPHHPCLQLEQLNLPMY